MGGGGGHDLSIFKILATALVDIWTYNNDVFII